MQTTQQQTDLLTVTEVARRLRVDATTVRRWIRGGILETVVLPHVGKRQSYRIHAVTIQRMMEGGSTSA